ncbi:MAG: glycoside hydrolase family 3 N-terminal domain-containing protein [Thermoleophilaceae bacterium]
MAALSALLIVLALSGGEDAPQAPTAAQGGDRPSRAAAPRGPGVPRAISELVEEMSTDRKVAQLMLVGLEGFDTGDPVFDSLEELDYAGIVIGARNFVSEEQVTALADEASSVSGDADHTAPWVMAPQEGGEFNAFEGVPPEDAPAQVGSTREAAQLAEEAGEALLDLGLNGILAPVLDVGPSGGGAVGERAYSDVADQVTGYAIATVDAYEEVDIFAAAKHFPGLGSASQSTELGPANVGLTLDELEVRDLVPFRAAVEANVPGIVVGHGLYGVDDFVTPASTSETIVTDVLRDDLGFEGVAIADDLTAPAITSSFRTTAAAVDAVTAGIDTVYVSQDDELQRDVFDALSEAVRKKVITRERLDEAVTRTLVAKHEAGVLEIEGGGSGEPSEDGGSSDGGSGGGG